MYVAYHLCIFLVLINLIEHGWGPDAVIGNSGRSLPVLRNRRQVLLCRNLTRHGLARLHNGGTRSPI